MKLCKVKHTVGESWWCPSCPRYLPRVLYKQKLEWRSSNCVDLLWLVSLEGCQFLLYSKVKHQLHWLQSPGLRHGAELKGPKQLALSESTMCKQFSAGVLGAISDFFLTFYNNECNSSIFYLHIYLQLQLFILNMVSRIK